MTMSQSDAFADCNAKHETWRDHYLFIEVEAYSSALPPHDASVPKIPSDDVLSCPAMLAGRRHFCHEQRSSSKS